MITKVPISVRSARNQDRDQLANIIHFEAHVHRHLDWRPPLEWLGFEPYVVAEQGGKLIAALACPPDPPGVAWIRVFAATSKTETSDIWEILWQRVEEYLRAQHISTVAAIPLQEWFKTLLVNKGFTHAHNVIVLIWEESDTPLIKPKHEVNIRKMEAEDLEEVQQIDEEAFGSIWRNSLESIKLAFQQNLYATVATNDKELIGYQISTPSPIGAHLARLAVLPKTQGIGIGYSLVHDLQEKINGSKLNKISVNTQNHNASSLALYKKAGFYLTGEEYPVFEYNLIE